MIPSIAAIWAALMIVFPWWAASLLSNVVIIATEHINRHATAGWLSVLPQTLPLIVIAQFCLFRAFNGAPHWMWAWAVFALGNATMRLVAVGMFGTDGMGNWLRVIAGVVIMLGGALFMKSGLR